MAKYAKIAASKAAIALACLLCFVCFGCASNQNVSRVLVDKNGRLASVQRTMPTFNKGMLTKYGVSDSGETTVQNSALGLTSPDSQDKTYPYRPPVMNSPQMEMQQNLRPADGFKYQPNAQQSIQHQAFMQQNQAQQGQNQSQKPLNQQKSFVNNGGANAADLNYSSPKTPNKTLESQYQQGIGDQRNV